MGVGVGAYTSTPVRGAMFWCDVRITKRVEEIQQIKYTFEHTHRSENRSILENTGKENHVITKDKH